MNLHEKLITMNIPTYEQLDQDAPAEELRVVTKIFNPNGAGTWYIISYDPDTRIAFGYVSIFGDWNDEYGSFSVYELDELRPRPLGLPLEIDLCFTPKTGKEVETKYE
jgi:hypothetical protein